MCTFDLLKQEAYQQNFRLVELGLVVQTFGNVSVSDPALGVFAIKPSGVPYSALTPDQMVVVDFAGQVVEGALRPSSDTPTHAALYAAWPGVRSIAHTHSRFGTVWAQAMRSIPLYGTTHADYCAGDIPCIPPLPDVDIAADYEYQSGLQIVRYFVERRLKPTEVQMALLGGHAPFTWGYTSVGSVDHAAILEYLAELAFLTEQVNPDALRLKPALVHKHYSRKHGSHAYYGQRTLNDPDMRKSYWLTK